VQFGQRQVRFGSDAGYDPVVLVPQPGKTISTHGLGRNAAGSAKLQHPLSDGAIAQTILCSDVPAGSARSHSGDHAGSQTSRVRQPSPVLE